MQRRGLAMHADVRQAPAGADQLSGELERCRYADGLERRVCAKTIAHPDLVGGRKDVRQEQDLFIGELLWGRSQRPYSTTLADLLCPQSIRGGKDRRPRR